MPIQFRCHHCQQLLSVSSKRAGSDVKCPKCAQPTRVPAAAADPVFEVPPSPPPRAERRPENPPVPLSAVSSPREPDAAERKVHRAPLPSEPVATAPATAPPPADAWQQHPDPWREEIEEDEGFQIAKPMLVEAGLDMTPMVDVTFLLLIFFMITAAFSLQKSLETTAPNPDDSAAAKTMNLQDLEEESVVVSIDEENRLLVDDEPVAGISELRDVLTNKVSAGGKREMLLEVDPRATHGMVVAVTDVGLTVQMQRIRRAMRPGGRD